MLGRVACPYLAVRHHEPDERVVGVAVEVGQVFHDALLQGFAKTLGEVPRRIIGVLCCTEAEKPLS